MSSQKTRFKCREPGHFMASCSYNNRPAQSVFSNSVNGPRQPAGGSRGIPAKPQFGKATVNHVYAEDADTAPGVLLGEFLVQSVLASVLFDSGASHSFISSHFVKTYDIATVALKRPLLTKSPGGYIHCHIGVNKIPLNLSGVVFLANLVVLNSHGIDVILGMD
jgi:hypothetical protein